MEFSPKKTESGEASVSIRKDIVIPDECGDSLWDAVLEQDRVQASPANSGSEDKGPHKDGNAEKQASEEPQ